MVSIEDVSLERCCRLCAEEQEVTLMIFSEEAETLLLHDKLTKYLSLEVVENDKLPKYICIRCCTKLTSVCEFIDMARKAQEILLNRSLYLENLSLNKIKTEIDSDTDNKITEMEVNVDPMMILQNSDEELLSPLSENNLELETEDVTYLHSVDSENVTIKLIKKVDKTNENKTDTQTDDKKDGNAKPFACTTCKRSYFSDLALKNHSWIHNIGDTKNSQIYKCNQCQEGFDYKYDLLAHLKDHRTKGMCRVCGRVFRSQRNLEIHMEMHLTPHKTYNCKVCGRSYNTQSNLKTHSITHSAERPFQCHICKKSFKRNQDLKFHINQHTGAKPYKCPFCEKCFASSGNCYSHRSRMHPGRRVESKLRRRNTSLVDNPTLQAPNIVNVKGIFKYKCQICGHSFLKRDNYMYHMYQHTGEKPFQCSYCSEKFVTRRGLLIHHDKEHSSKDRPLALLSKNILLK